MKVKLTVRNQCDQIQHWITDETSPHRLFCFKGISQISIWFYSIYSIYFITRFSEKLKWILKAKTLFSKNHKFIDYYHQKVKPTILIPLNGELQRFYIHV